MQNGSCANPRPALLGLAISLALGPAAALAQSPTCSTTDPACTRQASQATLCGRYPLYDDRVTDLAPSTTEGQPTVKATTDHIDSPDGRQYQLVGHAQLQYGDQVLRADRVDWQRDSGNFDARDKVRYQNTSLLLQAAHMQGNSESGTGSAEDVDFQMRDSRGNGHAGEVSLLGDNKSRLGRVSYTTCSPDHTGWELRAKRVDIDQSEEVGRARNVTMRLDGVPILWLPYVRFPTSDRRQSGLLYPTLGYDESRGFDLTLPWYLNLAPNADATLYPRVIGRRGAMLGAEFRYLTDTSRGTIRGDYLAHDRIADRSRGLLRARSTTSLGQNWRFNVNINHVSDRSYFEDLGSSLYSNATHLLRSAVYLDGRGHGWHAAVGADQYQITDPDLPESYEPYKRLPRAIFDAHGQLGRTFTYGIDSEFVSFHKDSGLDGRRLDLEPYADWNLQGPWWYVNPHLAWRTTRYALDRDNDSSPSRSLPIASVDAGLSFERPAALFGRSYTQTLEPRLYYLRVPYRDQSDIPIFDTSYQTFDYWQLFSPNRFSGADRQMNANDLTLALTSRLLGDDGSERLSASIGQIRYFEPQRVQLPGRAETDYSGSAYVAQVSSRLSEHWQLNLAQQWNPNGDYTELSTVALQHRTWRNGIINMAYRYRRNYLEQLDFSTSYPLNGRWNLVGRWNYSLDQGRTLEALAGIEYNSCCVAVRLLGRHYIRNSAGDISNGIMLQIEFKGIGSVGQGAENLLRHAILGYQDAELPVPQTGTP